jgi:hypothetical protein
MDNSLVIRYGGTSKNSTLKSSTSKNNTSKSSTSSSQSSTLRTPKGFKLYFIFLNNK